MHTHRKGQSTVSINITGLRERCLCHSSRTPLLSASTPSLHPATACRRAAFHATSPHFFGCHRLPPPCRSDASTKPETSIPIESRLFHLRTVKRGMPPNSVLPDRKIRKIPVAPQRSPEESVRGVKSVICIRICLQNSGHTQRPVHLHTVTESSNSHQGEVHKNTGDRNDLPYETIQDAPIRGTKAEYPQPRPNPRRQPRWAPWHA